MPSFGPPQSVVSPGSGIEVGLNAELVQGIQRPAAVRIRSSEFVLALLRSLSSVAGSRAGSGRREGSGTKSEMD
jgi:hypothetical protein